MTLGTKTALAGMILMALCSAAQAKSAACACHLVTKEIHHGSLNHTSARHAPARHARTNHAGASRHAQNDSYDYYNARQTNEDVYNIHQTSGQRDEQFAYRQDDYSYGDGRVSANGPPRALNGQDVGREQYAYRQDDYSYGDDGVPADGPSTQLNGRDFSGGVGYGQSGDMGYYQGGYGRFDPHNGNTAGMNGGVDRARMSVWHGYNGHNGLGNGY